MNPLTPTVQPPILLVAETRWGGVERVTFELLGDARKLAASMKGRVEMVLPAAPSDCDTLISELKAYIQEPIHVVLHDNLRDYSTEAWLAAVQSVSERLKPSVLVIAATTYGRDYGPRLAARLGAGYLPHCLTLRASTAGKIEITRVTHGGRIHAQSIWTLDAQVVITMKPGVADAPPPLKSPADPAVVPHQIDIPSGGARVIQRIPADPATQDIREAERIVAGGRGVGGAAGFAVLRELADAMHASVAASRVAVDQGWIEHARQVGQTGKTVSPRFYLAAGISGASHHLQGMRGSEKIVALNKDRNAPIFSVSHFGLVGDLHEILPRVTARVRRDKEEA
jgi:electron transfer flavoprotein alpha subunit